MKSVTYEDIARAVGEIIVESRGDLDRVEFVVGISRGGLFPAMVVATTLVKPLVAAYIDKQDNVYFDRGEWIAGKKVLLVDDIIRTGKTIGKIKELLLKEGAAEVKMLTPYYLAEANEHAPHFGKVSAEDIVFPWDE
jgi:hypoxanthine phosphoribosyltransferase